MAVPSRPALHKSIKSLTTTALASSVLVPTPTAASTSVVLRSGVNYRVHYCPSLLQKPVLAPKSPSSTAVDHTANETNQKMSTAATPPPRKPPKPNPFLPPHPALTLSPSPYEGYNIVLNRFPIIPHHFLLCTADFQPQDEKLAEMDLVTMYRVLVDWVAADGDGDGDGDGGEERLVAFFNSGAESGASQPHRHVQFLPLPAGQQQRMWGDDTPTDERGKGWSHPGVPFVTYALSITRGEEEEVGRVYRKLMAKMEEEEEEEKEEMDGWNGSYNMACTAEWMVVLPRRRSGEVNGAVLCGELVVKDVETWDVVMKGGEGARGVVEELLDVGVERNEVYWEGKGELMSEGWGMGDGG